MVLDRRNTFTDRFSIFLFAALLLALSILVSPASGQTANNGNPPITEGSLLYKSPTGEQQFIPLVHTDVELDVRGLVAAATVTQQYENSSSRSIEAIYVFPLPHDAAVYDMEIRIGNRVIRSVIKERQEAKRTYEAAKSAGKRAALVEEERPNIFTASVANIMPGDRIDVRLRYVEPLRWEDGKVRLVFPMVVGPRYIPGTEATGHSGTGWAMDTNQVPDASRITPAVRNPLSRPGHDISLAVNLDAGFQTGVINSVSHEIKVSRLHDGRQRVELLTGTTIPNRDFVLEIEQARSTQPASALFLSPGTDGTPTHFLFAAYPPSVAPSRHMPVEMLYMIDVSGSMEGTSIQQARGALLQALDKLTPDDRFNIVWFNHEFDVFSPESLPATSANVENGRRFVQKLQAGGGTEMLPALKYLMAKRQLPGYLRHIVLLTDGDLGNEEEIFTALHHDLGNARLYTVAIGSAPNLFLATKMAQFGRGTFTHIADNREIQEKMGKLFATIESPVLTDVKLSFEGVEVAGLYPARTPDLFMNQPLLVSGEITRGSVGKIHLTAHAGDQGYEMTIPFDTAKATFHPGITTIWARQRVEDLMDQWRQTDQVLKVGVQAAIVEHAIRYHLVTRFTSLVAVEEIVVNPGGPSSTTAVPSELPAGWNMEKVFGAPATGTADAFLEALGFALLLGGTVLFLIVRRTKRAGELA